MTMTPYDAFVRDMWWLLQAIKKETLASGSIFEFHISDKDEGAPPVPTQRNLLQCLKKWRVLNFLPPNALKDKLKEFSIKISSEDFNNLYLLFENGQKLNISSFKLYNFATHWFDNMRFGDTKAFEAWQIMKGKMKPAKMIKPKTGTPTEAFFKLPEGTKWQDIEIKFKDRFDIEVFVGGKFLKSAACTDLGFFRSRTKDVVPDKQWELLHLLAMIYITSKQQKMSTTPARIADLKKAFGTENSVMTTKKKLSQQLQVIFGIKADPFEDYTACGYYQTKFKLLAEPELRHDKPFEYGASYDDTLAYDTAIDE